MTYGYRALGGLHLLEEKNRGNDQKAGDTHDPEIIHESHEHRLADKLLKNKPISQRIRHASSGLRQKALDLLERDLIGRIVRRQVTDQDRLVDLAHSREQGRRKRDPDPSADITHQIKKSRGIAHFLLMQSSHGDRGQRHKNGADPDPGPDNGPYDIRHADLQIDIPKIATGQA